MSERSEPITMNKRNINSTSADESGMKEQNSVHPPSQATLDEFEKKIQNLESQIKEKENKYKYLYADFENFKKRSIKERSDLIKFGWESVARELLQVLDNLERALSHIPQNTDKTLSDGLKMIANQFRTTLYSQGVQSVESLGKSFDPNLHEAISQESSKEPEGKIIQEHLPGYTLHGRLLRPARVVVSGGQSKSGENES